MEEKLEKEQVAGWDDDSHYLSSRSSRAGVRDTLTEGRAKGHVLRLPHPADKSPSHPATLSVWGPRGSPESQVAGALGDTQTEPSLDQVLRERDEAIAKKRAVEAELDIFKAKLRAVEAQLLEVLEEKLRLRQEVEAWEDDMQRLVRQQVESQLQRESRGALGAPMDPGTARTPWVRFSLSWWGRWR
ncbi:BICD family-like cargo adapter 1 [Mesoplodon densirostris]|uniref:BICD family-like cargo adapter 1 n=1 Tax=Mesoplodon densirostris TaxID=48708 RepID=UPI0028DAF98E|nr:BICD family-like cargo adapter 1 [Mesoplodon densirostris]